MKPNFILTAALTAFCLLSTTYSHAQIPQGFNYQAVLRDGGGDIIANDLALVRFTIHQTTAGGTTVYQETHTTSTNEFGLVNLVIGQGAVNSGTFSTITWKSNLHYLQVEVNTTGTYLNMGTQQLMSVPYSFAAKEATDVQLDELTDVTTTGATTGQVQQLMSVPYALAASNAPNSWSLTGNANTNENTQFIGTTDYVPLSFRVNNEKAGRIDVALNNTFLGYKTGNVNTTGYSNTAVGYKTLSFNTEGYNNSAFGTKALYSNTTGYQNTANGMEALYYNTTGYYNTASGYEALYSNTTGNDNNASGYEALYSNTTGNDNTASGRNALFSNVAGSRATAIGTFAMHYAYNTATPFDNENVAVGYSALGGSGIPANNTGNQNTALGYQTLNNNSSGFQNTATGYKALQNNTTGNYNTATGGYSLYNNSSGGTGGDYNTANGYGALYSNTTGYYNTASGKDALYYNTTGYHNTANGWGALYSNTTGQYNTASGKNALYSNTTGQYNTASGNDALALNTTGYRNTASGWFALYSNTTGNNNTACGEGALESNLTGNWNTAIGGDALHFNSTGSNNTASGLNALYINTTGDFNTAIGKSADVSTGALFNATAIGYNATVNASNKVRIGNTFVTVIQGQVAYSFPSDGRFKNNITESDVKGLEFIKLLRPVEYNFDTKKFEEFLTKNMPDSTKARHFEDTDFSASTAIRQSGFVAQEVEQAMEESGYNFNGVHAPADENDNYSVAYSLFVVPLVKGMQEQQMMIEELKLALEQSQNEKVQMQFDFETRLTSIENRLLNKEQR